MLSVLVPFGAGYICLHLLCRNHPLSYSMKFGLSYGLGLGMTAIWMLFLYICHQPFNLNIIRLPLMLLIIIGLIVLFNIKKSLLKAEDEMSGPVSAMGSQNSLMKALYAVLVFILFVYIAHNIYYVLWRAMTVPISSWDAIATVAFKGKIFFYEQTPPPLELLPHRSYPLFVPFIQSWIGFNLGFWDDILVKIIFPCMFLSYLAIHYNFLAHFTNRTWALIGCAVLVSSNLFVYHATISYRDFSLMYFNCTTVMLLLLWNQKKSDGLLVLAALFAGFATFTKLEGSSFLLIYSLLFILMNFPSTAFTKLQKFTNSLKFFLPSFSIALIYHIYKIYIHVIEEKAGMREKIKFDFTWEKMAFIPEILYKFAQNLFFSGNWGVVWMLVILSLIGMAKKRKTVETKLILLSLFLFFGLYFAISLLTTNYVWIVGEKGVTSLSRLLLHFYPLSVLLIVLLNYSVWSPDLKKTSSLNPK